MTPVLQTETLTKVFSRPGQPDLTAVDHVSFQLMPGECLGLIGESGSGKSTVAQLIARLLNATGGRILLDGADITRLRGRALLPVYQTLQMVFQNPADSFDPRRTLGDGIGEPLRNRRLPKADVLAQVGRLLEQCCLDAGFAARYPHQVSGGQCQRAAIARALAVQPRLLICDEATASLDVTAQKEILDLLSACRARAGQALSILFISHDISLVQQFCDRVLVMHRGKIVEQGVPDAILRAPQHPYTRQLIDSIL